MLLVDFREAPPPSAVAPDVQHACLSLLYLCGYCESANLQIWWSSERSGREGLSLLAALALF